MSVTRRASIPAFAIITHNFFANRKVRRAGNLGSLVFVFALLRNAERGRTGSFPASDLEPWYLADQLMIGEPEAVQARARAIEAGLLRIDGDNAVIVGWGPEWSRASVSESEARQLRRQRGEPDQNQNQNQNKNKNKNKRSPDKSGLGPDDVRTIKRKSPLREDWGPREQEIAKARELGVDAVAEAEKMRNWAVAKGESCVDWDARFRNWLIKASEGMRRPAIAVGAAAPSNDFGTEMRVLRTGLRAEET